jgi:hypothetical protein
VTVAPATTGSETDVPSNESLGETVTSYVPDAGSGGVEHRASALLTIVAGTALMIDCRRKTHDAQYEAAKFEPLMSKMVPPCVVVIVGLTADETGAST